MRELSTDCLVTPVLEEQPPQVQAECLGFENARPLKLTVLKAMELLCQQEK